MSTTPFEVCAGRPQFGAPDLARMAQEFGAVHAWRSAMSAHPEQAAVAVRDEFAIGLHSETFGSFGAVDKFGIQALYWRVEGSRLLFAGSAGALAGATAAIDPQAIFDYLYFHCIPSPRTVYKGVFRLPPGHCVKLKDGHLSVAPYWTPSFSQPPAAAVSFDALKATFRERLQQSVARQLDGGTPACFLSGGTDSSTIAGMIGLATGQPAHSFSIGFEAAGYDEMAFARLVAGHFKTEHHEYYVTPADLVRSIPLVAQHYDQPFGNSSALPAYYCAKLACDAGVTRILAGDGGDELFGGNSRYAKQRIFGWYQQLPESLRTGLLQPLLEQSSLGTWPGLKKARSYIEQARVPMPDRLQMYNLLMRLGITEVLTPEFLATVDLQGPQDLQRTVWRQAKTTSELNRTLAFDWRFTLADSDLPKVRGTAALAGIDVAFPFLDEDLTQFSAQLPDAYKLKGLKLRWFFKEALRGFLPDEVITKKKQGFGLPFGVWAVRHKPLMDLATTSLQQLAKRGIVKPLFIKTLLEARLPEHPGYYGEMVWVLMMLEQWLQGHPAASLSTPA